MRFFPYYRKQDRTANNKGLATSQLIIIVSTMLILASIPLVVYLVKQRQEVRKYAQEVTGDGELVCDSSTADTNPSYDPYNSKIIVVTNKTTERIHVVSNVFRCAYEQNADGSSIIKKSYFFCDSECNPAVNPNCRVGVWDQPASGQVWLDPLQSHTFSMTVNNCEIAQIDAYNDNIDRSYVDAHPVEAHTACYNRRSPYTNPTPPYRWPGGIAFGIAENGTGYVPGQGCPTPTVTPTASPTPPTPTGTATPTPTGTRTPTPTPTRTPTPPPATPRPTSTLIVIVPTAPPGSTATPTPLPPVSGNLIPTILTVVGGGILLLVGLLL